MRLSDGRYRILLHLQAQRGSTDVHEHKEAPYRICQNGIAEAVDLSRNRTSEIIRELIEDGLAQDGIRRVVGLKRRRKVYSLTPMGLEKAEDVRDRLEREKVTVKTDSSEYQVRLESINSYIESRDPLLVALNNLTEDDVIDLTQPRRQREDTFVGRIDEMDFLTKTLQQTKSEGGSTIMIKGKAGIGKTRLLSEFKHRVLSEDFDFIMGKGHYDRSEPYLPFKEAFKTKKMEEKTTPLEFSTTLEEERGIKGENDAKNKRYLVFSETTDNIKELVDDRPTVIFLDDFQWADKASLMFFHYLAEKINELPILLIAAYRPEDIYKDDFLTEVLQRMSRQHLYKEIELEPLRWKDTKEIVQGLVGRIDIPDDFVHMIHDTSEGNPLFAKEFVKQMLEDETVEPKSSRFPSKKEDIDLPKVVNDIIERRINRLGKENLKVLQFGSIIGEDIPFSLLHSVCEIDSFDMLEYIDILTGSGLWESEPDEDVFTFAHGLIHATVYDGIPDHIKKDLHKKVASCMEKVFQEEIEEHYSDIAYNYKVGGDIVKAMSYYRKGGERAERMYAHEDALEMYKEALKLAEKADLEEEKIDFEEKIGDIYKIIGEYRSSLEHYQMISIDDLDTVSQQRIYRKRASVHEKIGDFDKTLEHVAKGLSDFYENSIETCRLYCLKGFTEIMQGRYDVAEQSFLKADEIFEDFDDDAAYADIQQGLGVVYIYIGKQKEAVEYLERALERWKEIDNLEGKSACLNNLGCVYLNSGELDKALELFKEGLEIGEKIGDKKFISFISNNMGTIYSKKGDMERSIEHFKKSHKLWTKIGDKRGMAISLLNIGEYHFNKGDLKTALENHQRCLSINQEINAKKGEATCFNNIGMIHTEMGDLEKGKRYFDQSLEICREIGYKYLQPHPMCSLVEIYIQENDIDKAMETAERSLELAQEIGARLEEGISHVANGIVHREKKDRDRAIEEFEKAKNILEEVGDKKQMAILLYHHALLFEDMGEEEKFKKYIKDALSMFDDMGMELWVQRCEEELQ